MSGSVGLAVAGAIFGSSLSVEVPRQLAANGVPQTIAEGLASRGETLDGELTAVGVDLGGQVLGSLPAGVRPAVEPFIDQIVSGIHEAFSIAIANALWLGVAGAVGATIIVAVLVPELTLRRTPGRVAAQPEAVSAAGPLPE